MLKSRSILEENLIPVIESLNAKTKIINGIKKELLRNEILPEDVQTLLNDPEDELPKIDVRFLYLFTSAIYKYRTEANIKPLDYFTTAEVKESVTFSGLMNLDERLTFPQYKKGIVKVSNDVYLTEMDIKDIKKYYDAGLLFYNFDTQREHRKIISGDEVIAVPKVNEKSVKQIADHLLNGTLVPTLLTFNAAVRTSDEGDELLYKEDSNELVITKGTRLDIIDGYHRTKGIQRALSKNPNLSFSFPVMFTNYKTSRARDYIGQISKANPIEMDWADQLSKTRHADDVVAILQQESDLKGKVSQTKYVSNKKGELVSYRTLTSTINEEFEMHNKADSTDVAEYLVDFFDYLFGANPEAFLTNISNVNKNSLINENVMFAGYIVLAKRMFENEIKVSKLKKIIQNIDFNRDNSLWNEIGVIKDGKLNKDSSKNIRNYFKNIEILEERVTH